TLAAGGTLASIGSSAVTTVASLHDVAATAGGLTLNDRTLSGTVPAINTSGGAGGFGGAGGSGGSGGGGAGSGSFRANFSTSTFGVDGVDIGGGELGPLSSGKLSAGRTFSAADASSDVALLDASYATQNKLIVGSTIAIGNSKGTTTNFKVVGLVSEPAAAIRTVSTEIKQALPADTVTTSSDLASEVTGSLSSASSLANNLGKWLAIRSEERRG